jgi:hypothetical protein
MSGSSWLDVQPVSRSNDSKRPLASAMLLKAGPPARAEKELTDIQSVKRQMKLTVVQHDGQNPLDLDWDHQPHGSFIRGPTTEISLLFDSTARRWTLRIYKKQTSFGQPVTYEIAFKERYSPTTAQAIAMANTILNVELGTPISELNCA